MDHINHLDSKSEGFAHITVERYDQLIRAEQDARHLKAFILQKYESFLPIDRNELKLLVNLFIGLEEEEEEDV